MSLMIKKLVAVSLAAAVLTGGAVTANARGWYDHGHGWGHGYGFGYHNYWGYGDYYGCSFVSRPWGTVKVCPNAY